MSLILLISFNKIYFYKFYTLPLPRFCNVYTIIYSHIIILRMKFSYYFSLLWLLCLPVLQTCSLLPKPEPTLPSETQIGANTFGCLVNGKLWLPVFSIGSPGLTTSFAGGLQIKAYNSPESIQIYYDRVRY